MSEAVRYLCVARLGGKDWYFLWESGDDDPDRVVLDDGGAIVTFPSEEVAREGAVSPEQTSVYDLDAIEAWCRSPGEAQDCSTLLNAWNLFGDLPRAGTLFGEADARATPIYDKLFWGSNLPSVTPPGEHFVPTWSATETAALKHLLLLGLAELRARLR